MKDIRSDVKEKCVITRKAFVIIEKRPDLNFSIKSIVIADQILFDNDDINKGLLILINC